MKSIKCLMFVLCVAMMIGMVGCGQKENVELLPFELEFGNNFEEVQCKLDIGELKDSSSNDGYVSDLKYISNEEEITEIIGTSEGISDVAIALAFNADEKLYEFYCFFTVENNKLSQTNDIIKNKFNKVAGEEEDEPNGIALWKNEEYTIDYSCQNRLEAFAGEDASCLIVIHSYELDFE